MATKTDELYLPAPKGESNPQISLKRKSSDDANTQTEGKKFAFGVISNGTRPKPFGGVKIALNQASSEKKSFVPKTNVFKPAPIKMSLGASSSSKPKEPAPVLTKAPSNAVAKAFGAEDDSDEEEMPLEAKMRMRNIGRQTPTASGPNSFGKGRLGFCDRRALIKKELEEAKPAVGALK